jgi:hypothetical protein
MGEELDNNILIVEEMFMNRVYTSVHFSPFKKMQICITGYVIFAID